MYGIMGIILDPCRRWYFLHHFLTVIMFKSMWMIDHYTWFLAFPGAYHCIMVCYPNFAYNNQIYVLSLICFIFNILMIKPFNQNRVHLSLIMKILLLIIPLVPMAMMSSDGGCKELWDFNAMVEY